MVDNCHICGRFANYPAHFAYDEVCTRCLADPREWVQIKLAAVKARWDARHTTTEATA